jgi:glycosidase
MEDEVIKSTGDQITEPGSFYGANLTKNLNFFREFNFRLKSVFPDAFVVGENFDGWDARIAPYYEVMDSQFDFQHYYHLMNMMYGIGESANPQQQAFVFEHKFNQVFAPIRRQFINGAFTSNHDVPRVLNWVKGSPVSNNIVEKQTITPSDYLDARARAWAFNAATLLMPGVSWIYYGDELGMTSNWLPNLDGTTFHKDRFYRQPFKWDNDPQYPYKTGYSFEGFTIDWDSINANATLVPGANQQLSDPSSMHRLFRSLTHLKHSDEALINGTFYGVSTGHQQIMAFRRVGVDSTYYVYINFSNQDVTLTTQGNMVFSWNFATSTNLPGYAVYVSRVNHV